MKLIGLNMITLARCNQGKAGSIQMNINDFKKFLNNTFKMKFNLVAGNSQEKDEKSNDNNNYNNSSNNSDNKNQNKDQNKNKEMKITIRTTTITIKITPNQNSMVNTTITSVI